MSTTSNVINLPTANTITIDTSSMTGSSYTTLPVSTNGSYLTATSSNYTWTNPNTNFSSGGSGKTVMTIPHNSDEVIIEPAAALNVKGKVIINGENLGDRLERIETLLNIPSRDIEMEREFPKLKELWEEYMHELEKYKTWKKLKDES